MQLYGFSVTIHVNLETEHNTKPILEKNISNSVITYIALLILYSKISNKLVFKREVIYNSSDTTSKAKSGFINFS